MYEVVKILLHRPFISTGHLHTILPENAFQSFSECAAAANKIARFLESFERVHSFALAPYFIFYASYVSATIHVRVAAQKNLEFNALLCLRICLRVFDTNSTTNPPVKKAKAIILGLMDLMGVSLPQDGDLDQSNFKKATQASLPGVGAPEKWQHSSFPPGPVSQVPSGIYISPEIKFTDLDFDSVLQSFSANNSLEFQAGPDITTSMGNMNQFPPQNIQFAYPQFPSSEGSAEDFLLGVDGSSPEERW